MTGVEMIALERSRQKEKWGDEHDNDHDGEELAKAAAHLASPRGCDGSPTWGMVLRVKHSGDRIRQLTIAGALIASEIGRLKRSGDER